jgi:hypothetical protein
MRDIESLLEVMNESEDWMDQVDAAEGLVTLGDRRGLQYLLFTLQSDDEDVRQTVQEILESPEVKRMREQIESEARFAYQKGLENAKARLQKGGRVFMHKVIYLPAGDILQEDLSGDGFHIPDLDSAGLDGWEVVNILARRRQLLVGSVDDHFVGAYVFLKKEIGPGEADVLDQ